MKKRWMSSLAAAAVLAMTGCASMEPAGRSPGAGSDRDLEGMVVARLQADPILSRASVSVSVREGVVTLFGTAPDPGTALRIKAQARSTPGVRGVIDQLTVF